MSPHRDVAAWCEGIPDASGEILFPTSIAHVGHDHLSIQVGMGLAATASWLAARIRSERPLEGPRSDSVAEALPRFADSQYGGL